MAKAVRVLVITGATGQIGGRVAARLAARSVSQRLIVRDASRAPNLAGAEVEVASSYGDTAAMTEALAGAQTLLLVSAKEGPERVDQHKSAVNAAVAAGIRRIVYVSFLNAAADSTFTFARDHYATEQYIRSTGLAFTFLQDSLYLDSVSRKVSADGIIAGPAGDGVVACVARDDVADAAVAVLEGDAHDGRTYKLTGPVALSMSQTAETLAAFAKRPITYKNETIDEAYASRAAYDAPPIEVEGWVTSYQAIATGEMSTVSDDVLDITGRRPATLPEFLLKNPASYAHLLRLA